ncbi:hypothetical protein [Brachyspira hampsonii]|uniref:hypothetical protein n=1 Tax=Brachyspira hampsonii TaxID=1287055 RepID=UPI000B2190BD|nr:hypothetical protein [Brachyspira hampsonii]
MICDICQKNINDDEILEGQINIKYKDKDGIEKEKEKEGKLCISLFIFFRWNLVLDKLGFKFKETAVWEKENASNYLNNFLRIHEDISFRSLGNANLRKEYVDYLEYQINKNKLDRIIDIWRGLRSALNSKDKDDVIKYIETGIKEFNYESKRKNFYIFYHRKGRRYSYIKNHS